MLQNELRRHGIDLSLKFLPKGKLPHDRLLYSSGQAINMPPFGAAYGDHKPVSEFTRSHAPNLAPRAAAAASSCAVMAIMARSAQALAGNKPFVTPAWY